MVYLERAPSEPLASSVQLLWYTSLSGPLKGRERILPSGCVQIILNLSRDYILECKEGAEIHKLPPSLVVGARSIYEIVDRSDMAELMGIVFRPAGFSSFGGDSVDLFSNRNVSLEDVWGAKAKILRERLSEALTPASKLQVLEVFLVKSFARRRCARAPVEFALERFSREPLVSRISEVAADTGWSMRRFSQVFREEVGLTPKVWCRLRRFERALLRLHAGADVEWADLALDCGYYDQSHFSNEFRAFSGIDATSYCASRTQWVNHVPA